MRTTHKAIFLGAVVLGLGMNLALAQNAGTASGYPTPRDGFTAAEQRGHGLYLRYCFECHGVWRVHEPDARASLEHLELVARHGPAHPRWVVDQRGQRTLVLIGDVARVQSEGDP